MSRRRSGDSGQDPPTTASTQLGQLAGLAAVTCGVKPFDSNLPAPAGAVHGQGQPITGALPSDVARQSDCVQAIAWYGVFDFATLRDQAGAEETELTAAIQAAPAGYVRLQDADVIWG